MTRSLSRGDSNEWVDRGHDDNVVKMETERCILDADNDTLIQCSFQAPSLEMYVDYPELFPVEEGYCNGTAKLISVYFNYYCS